MRPPIASQHGLLLVLVPAACRSLGCHRVVNYKEERLKDVLKNEYPRGVDVVYESGVRAAEGGRGEVRSRYGWQAGEGGKGVLGQELLRCAAKTTHLASLLPLPTTLHPVGGDMFDAAVNALAPRGRLLVIGMMSAYADGWAQRQYPGIAEKLLWKSATLQVGCRQHLSWQAACAGAADAWLVRCASSAH